MLTSAPAGYFYLACEAKQNDYLNWLSLSDLSQRLCPGFTFWPHCVFESDTCDAAWVLFSDGRCHDCNTNLTSGLLLLLLETHQARVAELEAEVEELRLLWKSEASSRSARSDVVHSLLPLSKLLNSGSYMDGDGEAARSPAPPVGFNHEGHPPLDPDPSVRIYDHECSCVRRAEVVKYRGISLLSEVDAQYSALQAKYDALLQHCHLWPQGEAQGDAHSRRSIGTAAGCPNAASATALDFDDDFHQPEYKELFREIFSRIQKTKEDLIENRAGL